MRSRMHHWGNLRDSCNPSFRQMTHCAASQAAWWPSLLVSGIAPCRRLMTSSLLIEAAHPIGEIATSFNRQKRSQRWDTARNEAGPVTRRLCSQ